jgi:hypothetical protein
MSNDFYNTEGYKDSTAYKAIMAIEEAKKKENEGAGRTRQACTAYQVHC